MESLPVETNRATPATHVKSASLVRRVRSALSLGSRISKMSMDLKMACVCSLEVKGSCEMSNPMSSNVDSRERLIEESAIHACTSSDAVPQISINTDDESRQAEDVGRGGERE